MLTKFVSIGSYSPEVEILDYVPRDLTILYLEIVDSIHNNRSLIQVQLAYTILAITRAAITVSYAVLSLSAYRGIL